MMSRQQRSVVVFAFSVLALFVAIHSRDHHHLRPSVSCTVATLEAHAVDYLSLGGGGVARPRQAEAARSPVGTPMPSIAPQAGAATFDIAASGRLFDEIAAVFRLSHQPPTAQPRAPPSVSS